MKKLTALFLTLILLVSLTVPAFAARDVSFETELAGELKQLGVFKGVSDTDFALGRAPTRLEALMMLIRALGKESEAASGSWTHPFTDVSAWWSPYVGYAYETKLTNGISATEFGTGNADARMYLTFMLRALGYSDGAGKDFLWNDPYSLAKEVGILPEQVNTEEFWRADVVCVTYAALNARMKDSEQTLAEKLIAADVFTAEQFEAVYREDAFDETAPAQVTPAPVTPAADRVALTAEEIYALCMPAVFYIEVYDDWGDAIASGSGFFIDANGTAVTNHHVIYGASSAKVTLSDSSGKEQETLNVLGVYDWSEEEDWAVLKVDCVGNSCLRIGDASTAVGGAQVYALGSPLGLSASISDGMISNPARELDDGQTYIQISAPISHGSSGGALVNKFGEVIGITAAGFDAGQNLNLAVPIEKIAGTARGELTPISDTYVIASGIVYPETRYVVLQPGESVANVITALKYDTEELLTVEYEIEDEDIVSCSWDGWGPEDTEVTLHLTAGDVFGGTYVYIYLYTTDSEELLDYDYIYVEVAGGTITVNKDSLDMELNDYDIIWVNTHCFDSREYNVRATGYDSALFNCAWGTWETTDGGHRIPLYLAALSSGSTELRLEMFDYETKEILATTSVYVTVIGGYLTLSDSFISLLPGESATVTVSGVAVDPNAVTYITTDEYPSDVIDWERGALSGNPATFTITAKDIGSDYIIITLLDQNGAILSTDYIDVYVDSGRLTADTSYLDLYLGDSATVLLSAAAVGDRNLEIRPSDYNDPDTVEAVLGAWNEDGTVPLTLTAKKCGGSYVEMDLYDADTDEYLASGGVYVYVDGGKLTFSQKELMLAPGETATVTITGTPLDGSQNAYLTTDTAPSNYIDWNRGRLDGNPATLTITAKAEGMDLIVITLYNENDELLTSDSVWVYVNMDGKGPDEIEGNSEPESEPAPALPSPSELNLENGAMKLAMGERVSADLNGDGTAEIVRLWLSGDENGFPVVRLSINDTDYSDALYELVQYFDCPDDTFWAITDIDAQDGLLEIAIQDWGPSDDLTTRFIRFDGSALSDLGCVEDFLFFPYQNGAVQILGRGRVHSEMRLDVLQTWWAETDYALGQDGKFAPVPQDYYESIYDEQAVTLLCDLYCYDAPDGTRSILPADTTAALVGTDNVSWIKLMLADGGDAWLHLTESGYHLECPEGTVFVTEALSGLSMAD